MSAASDYSRRRPLFSARPILNLFMDTLPETAAPSLLFISSFVSLILIVFQISLLHKSQWIIDDAQGARRLLVLSVMLLIVFLSALSATLGLIAHQAYHTGNRSLATRSTLGGKITVVILQFGLSMYMMFLLNSKPLVEPIPSPFIGVLTFAKVRVFAAVMSSPLVANTVLSIVFAALREDYPAARLPALCWLLFFIPLSCVSTLLYLSIRRAKEYSIIARMWLVLAVGHACGVLSAVCALVGKGDFQAPTSLFDAFWITCVTFALHIHSILPDPYPNSLLSGRSIPFERGGSPAPPCVCVNPTRPINVVPVRSQHHATHTTTASAEDFRTLHDPFAAPASALTEKPFPLYEAARIEKARKKSLSILLASTRHSSPAKLIQSVEDHTPPPSPPANVLVRAPRHASYSGAFGA